MAIPAAILCTLGFVIVIALLSTSMSHRTSGWGSGGDGSHAVAAIPAWTPPPATTPFPQASTPVAASEPIPVTLPESTPHVATGSEPALSAAEQHLSVMSRELSGASRACDDSGYIGSEACEKAYGIRDEYRKLASLPPLTPWSEALHASGQCGAAHDYEACMAESPVGAAAIANPSDTESGPITQASSSH